MIRRLRRQHDPAARVERRARGGRGPARLALLAARAAARRAARAARPPRAQAQVHVYLLLQITNTLLAICNTIYFALHYTHYFFYHILRYRYGVYRASHHH